MKQGLSLIETVIALAVLGLVAAVSIISFSQFRDRQQMARSSEQVTGTLARARSLTVFSQEESQYGVHFTSASVTLFKGVVFSPGDPDNQEINLTQVEISNINLNGGGADVVFQRLSGQTANFGTVTLSLSRDPGLTRLVEIKSTGLVQLQ